MQRVYRLWDYIYAVRDEGYEYTPSMHRNYRARGIIPPAVGRGAGARYTREHIDAAIAIRANLENRLTLDEFRDRLYPIDDEDDDLPD